jgi:hypothetical protein
MRRLGRKGRILKWAGLVLSLLIVIAWAASLRWRWGHFRSNGTTSVMFGTKVCDGFAVGLGSGSLCVGHFPVPLEQAGWFGGTVTPTPQGELRFSATATGWQLVLPLWIPFLFIAILTGYIWWLDRRHIPPGHCLKCGYNLTGNVSGICPECGQHLNETTA